MTAKLSAQIILIITAIVTIFHCCILLKLIPYNIAWGGRLENDEAMYVFEVISTVINLFFGWLVLMKIQFAKPILKARAITIILWIFFGLFVLKHNWKSFWPKHFSKNSLPL